MTDANQVVVCVEMVPCGSHCITRITKRINAETTIYMILPIYSVKCSYLHCL
jgi:hypothetical protein